jgi:NAD(P)-dependent dehydrogenase (short-subunit alcohol dehydrogenase family)
MSTTDASRLLRAGLLQGISVLLAGAPDPSEAAAEPAPNDEARSPAGAVRAACAGLGAHVSVSLPAPALAFGAEEAVIEEAVERVLADRGSIELLVLDGAGLFAGATRGAGAGAGEPQDAAALRACLDGCWSVTRAVVNHAFLARGRGGRILFIAPSADAGGHAAGARAGLQNLARTLSIEWARHAITVVAIAPRTASLAGEVAALTAYLASPAGAYFSGCQLELR